ncbi:MAG: SemiSWEET family sugar transporter [Terriglobales bacterium]
MLFPMTIATVIGFIAGTLTTVSFVPQVLKTFRTKRCDDLSFGMLAAFASGVCLWLVYGIFLWSAPIIVANLVTLCLLVPLVVMKIRYRRAISRPPDVPISR